MTQNRWNDNESAKLLDVLDLRVYSSRLLGRDPSLVMHGGGNTSAKSEWTNLFGEKEPVLYIKGSGWDLATIEKQGFPAVRMRPLLALRNLKSLGDVEMMNFLRGQLVDSSSPDPSVETLLHAYLPHRFVDHTHADSILSLTNQPDGENLIRKIFGKKVSIVPYIMPGFLLAKGCASAFEENDKVQGMVLLKHGIFSFGDTAKESYDRMIELVQTAEEYIKDHKKNRTVIATNFSQSDKAFWTQTIRKEFLKRGFPCVLKLDESPEALDYVNHPQLETISQRGPLTPDHVIRTKSLPLCLSLQICNEKSIPAFISKLDEFENNYRSYFERNSEKQKLNLTQLDSLPRVCLLPGVGILTIGSTEKDARINSDIYSHTSKAILDCESMSQYEALPESDLFEMEYWVLEQNKLKLSPSKKPLTSRIAVITGGAGGIGLGISKEFLDQGATVIALDINAEAAEKSQKSLPKPKGGNGFHFLKCDVSNRENVRLCMAEVVKQFGGIDVLVVNAGIFPASELIENITDESWDRSIKINLNGAFHTVAEGVKWMKEQGKGGDIVFITSKNVPAPGQKWGAYSVSKAGQTQLARIAALEAANHGIRVNMLHPHLVEDTSLWTEDVVAARAKAYSLTPEQYKKNNLLGVSLNSSDVARAAFALVGGYFSKTTGAQIAVDGGSDRTL